MTTMSAFTITVRIDLPDGVEVDAREYAQDHGDAESAPPADMYGSWAFAPDGDDSADALIWMNQTTLQDAVDELEPGTYVLCP